MYLYTFCKYVSFQIVLMVVGSDSVHMKEYSSINQKLAENTNCQDSDTLYSSGMFLYNNLIQNKIQH